MGNLQTVLITGGTGLIGKALANTLLKRGYHVIILTRKIPVLNPSLSLTDKIISPAIEYALWNVEEQTIDRNAINRADFIIHLAGAGIADKRWTRKRKEEIINSRVNSSSLIVNSLRTIPNQVKAVISTSAIGGYGSDPAIPNSTPFTENEHFTSDFIGRTCQRWEESIMPMTDMNKRLVILRVGIVLSAEGGAVKEFLKPMKFGIAPMLGNGKQMVSWIHIDDLVQIYLFAIENAWMNGVYNAVSPNSVSNKKLIQTLATKSKGFFILIQVPFFLLKIMIGQVSAEIVKSATVSADKIQQAGFTFSYPTIDDVLANLTK